MCIGFNNSNVCHIVCPEYNFCLILVINPLTLVRHRCTFCGGGGGGGGGIDWQNTSWVISFHHMGLFLRKGPNAYIIKFLVRSIQM